MQKIPNMYPYFMGYIGFKNHSWKKTTPLEVLQIITSFFLSSPKPFT